LAFSYTTDYTDKVGKFTKTGGTFNAASATTGTISFGPINGFNVSKVIAAGAITSTSVTTGTAAKLVPGTATTQMTIALTVVSNDQGYWWAEYY